MKQIIVILACLLVDTYTFSQCPPEDSVWHRIIYLRDSTNIKLDSQLRELMPLLSRMGTCPYKSDSTHASLLTRIGGIHVVQENYYTALKYLNEAKEMTYEHLGKPNTNPALLIRIYNNLRICYDALGQKNLKNAAIDSCIAISIRLKQGYQFSLGPMYSKTVSYMETGDYYRCIDYATYCENVVKDAGFGMELQTEYATWKMNAMVLLKQYNEAEQLTREYINSCYRVSAYRNVGALYGVLAFIKEQTGNKDSAFIFYKKSLAFYERAKNVSGCATTLNNTGDLFLTEFKRPDDALHYYRSAIPYARMADSAKNSIGESMLVFNSIGKVFVEKKMYDSAFTYFQKSFDEIHPGINENDLLKNSDKYLSAQLADYVTSLVLNKADAYLSQYENSNDKTKLAQAIRMYKVSDRLFDRIKFGQTDLEARLFWRSITRRLYEHAIKACYLQNNPSDAFYFFEKSRAVLLQDQLNEQKLLSADEVMRETQIRRELNKLEQEIAEAPAGSKRDALQNDLVIKKQVLDSLSNSIRQKNEFYYRSVLDTTFLSIADVQTKILMERDGLVEIFSGDSSVYLLLIQSGNPELKKINKTDFDRLSSAFIEFLSNPELANKKYNEFVSCAANLYQLMFGNVSLSRSRIIVSPDGKYFPVEALVTSQSSTGIRYFIEDHAVSYTYSARYLLTALQRNKSVSARNFMGVAPVRFSGDAGLPTLSGSDESLRNVQSHFNLSDEWITGTATRANFLQNYYRYKIVQLYTHATANGMNKEPVIYFSDSALLLSDLLYEKKPATDLIVLSACETGSGKFYEGEGVFSFNRGFAAIGIPSSIANLWRVENSSTYKLTELFYSKLAKGLPLDVALQQAKIEFIQTSSREKQLPYYWAAPILTGRTDAIDLTKSYAWMYAVGGILLVGIIVLVVRMGRRSTPSSSSISSSISQINKPAQGTEQ